MPLSSLLAEPSTNGSNSALLIGSYLRSTRGEHASVREVQQSRSVSSSVGRSVAGFKVVQRLTVTLGISRSAVWYFNHRWVDGCATFWSDSILESMGNQKCEIRVANNVSGPCHWLFSCGDSSGA